MTNKLSIIAPAKPVQISASSGSGAGNLLTPSPREVWQAQAGAAATINIDYGASTQIDTIFLGGITASGGNWQAKSATAMGGGTITPLAPVRSLDTGQSLLQLAAPVTTRYLQLAIAPTSGDAPLIGLALAGMAQKFACEWQAGRQPLDLSQKTRLSDGGFAINPGAIIASWRCTLADLNDADIENLWVTLSKVGRSNPVILVEGHQGVPLSQHIHYGLFDRLEHFEREAPGLNKWAISIDEWV